MNDLSPLQRIAAASDEAQTLRTPAELIAAGLADPGMLAALGAVAALEALAITPAIAELIDPAAPSDPISRQDAGNPG